MELLIGQVESLLKAMTENGRTATVDWTNRSIIVLSEVKTHPTIVLSSGPMTYQDKLFQIREK